MVVFVLQRDDPPPDLTWRGSRSSTSLDTSMTSSLASLELLESLRIRYLFCRVNAVFVCYTGGGELTALSICLPTLSISELSLVEETNSLDL